LIKFDMVSRQVVGQLKLARTAPLAENSGTPKLQELAATVCGTDMPQDIRISPDGSIFYVADMMADGIFLVDGESFKQVGFIPAGVGTHGLYPSRDGTKLYVANRGSHHLGGQPHGRGSISVIDFATKSVVATWPIPGGGSPDMGNIGADGKVLWLSARYDNVVYAIDTSTGAVTTIPVGKEPHGLTVWPQPGRYSLGHTGNMR
jgi:YVTN family beta-propeller protein